MPIQSSALKRCASCERWTGPRRVGEPPDTVEIDDEGSVGLCQGGLWDGSERRARSACGRWLLWQALAVAIRRAPPDSLL